MSRALPADLLPVVDSRGPSVANPGLRVLRWLDWGDDFRLQEGDELSFLKLTVNLFKKQAKPDSVLSRELGRLQQRSADRIASLRASGLHVHSLRAACAGRLRMIEAQPSASDPGLLVHRNLGTPYVPASAVRRLIEAGASIAADKQARLDADLIVFDAFPVVVPRLESDMIVPSNVVVPPEVAAQKRAGKRPAELMSVVPGSEFEFWAAASLPDAVERALGLLRAALDAFSTPLRASQDDEPEVEIAQGPVMVPVPDGSTTVMIARASTVHYQVHNGRIVAMFRQAGGRDVKAEEHASNVMMTDEVRKRLAKKKLLQEIDIEVEAVGNAWRIRGIKG